MFDFLKRKKKEEPEYYQFQEYGQTVPLGPGYEDPMAGATEIPGPAWNGGIDLGNDSDAWYGPSGGEYGIPTGMNEGIPPMPVQPEEPGITVAELPADVRPEPVPEDSTIAEDLRNIPPQPVEDCGATVPLVREPEPLMGIPAYEEPPTYSYENNTPTVGMPAHIAEESFVRVDTYTGPSLVGQKGVLEGQRFAFRAAVLTLGVDYSCDIVLPLGTPGISRRHLRFWLDGQTPCAMDLKSTYGSFLNGEKMKPGLVYNLKTGDVLKLGGDEEFRVE